MLIWVMLRTLAPHLMGTPGPWYMTLVSASSYVSLLSISAVDSKQAYVRDTQEPTKWALHVFSFGLNKCDWLCDFYSSRFVDVKGELPDIVIIK